MNCLRPRLLLLIVTSLVVATAAASNEAEPVEYGSNCVVEPNVVVEISSRIDGILDEVKVQRGDVITAGGVIANLEAGVERADLEHARMRAAMNSEIQSNAASADYGDSILKRVSELAARQVVSMDEIDRVRSEADIARYRLQQAHENKRLAEIEARRAREVLKRHTIVSPIDGVIAERYLNPGESVEEKPIVRIAQIDPLRVELVMPAAEFGLVHTGDTALVRLEGPLPGEHPAKVIIVDPIIDGGSGTFRITLELPNPERQLTSGLRCAVSFLESNTSVAATGGSEASLPSLVTPAAANATP